MSKISKNSIKFLLAGLSCMAPLSASGAEFQYQNNYYIPPHGLPAPQLLPPEIKNDDNSKKASENKENSNKMQKVLSALKDKKNYNKKNIIEYGPYLGLGVILLGAGITYAASRNNELSTLMKMKIDSFNELRAQNDKNSNVINYVHENSYASGYDQLAENPKTQALDNYYDGLCDKYKSNSTMLSKIKDIYEGRSYELLKSLKQSLIDDLFYSLPVGGKINDLTTYGKYNLSNVYNVDMDNFEKETVIFADLEYCGVNIPVRFTATRENDYSTSLFNVNEKEINSNLLGLTSGYISRDYSNNVNSCFIKYVNEYLKNNPLNPNDLKMKIENLCKLTCREYSECSMEKTNDTSYEYKISLGYDWPNAIIKAYTNSDSLICSVYK